jgi:peroxiredoxin
MSHRVSRLLAGILFASAIATASADPAPLPQSIQDMLTQMHIEKYSSLTLLDENGEIMQADAFAQVVKAKHAFRVSKDASGGGDPAVTFRLLSKEEAAKGLNKPPKLKEGDAFPAFHLARLDGTAIDNSALAGRYTLVSFYFATCAPCIREVPELNALAKRRSDLNVVAVTFDSPEESTGFVDRHHLDWPVVPKASDLINAVGVKAYPTLMLLDAQGRVVAFHVGGKSEPGAIDAWVDKVASPKT